MKVRCEECFLARRRERWLRPCRHWRWLQRGHMTPRRKLRIIALADLVRAAQPDAMPWIPIGALRLIANGGARTRTAQAPPRVDPLARLRPERSSLVNGWQPLTASIATDGSRIVASGE